MIPTPFLTPAHAPSALFPLVLNTGRIRDQWHTMTRTGRSPRLNRHAPEPVVELHPDDAERFDISAGELVRLRSGWGQALARAVVTDTQQAGTVFMPMHWSEVHGREVLVNSLVNPVGDPVSGEPESKHTPVSVEPFRPAWHAFLLSRKPMPLPDTPWAVSVRGDGLWRYELAGDEAPGSWRDWLAVQVGESAADGEWLDYADAANGRYRCALLREQRLMACLFVGPDHELPAREWLAGLFEAEALSSQARLALLSGRAPGREKPRGPVVCACFDVGAETIRQAIDQGCHTTGAIGAKVRAGTGCGSCLPELRAMLDAAQTPERAR